MKEIDTYKCSPYFDQDHPERPITGMIADLDRSESYELDAVAVFKCRGDGYLIVNVSGCSCWPDRGVTRQQYCATKTEVGRTLASWSTDYQSWVPLHHQCQSVGWKVTRADIFKDPVT